MKSNETTLVHLGRLGNEHFALDLSAPRILRLEPQHAPENLEQKNEIRAIRVGELFQAEHDDPMRPEYYRCDKVDFVSATAERRKVRKVLQSLSAPHFHPPLWRSGPSLSYSRLNGDTPSVAIVDLGKDASLFENPRDRRVHLHLGWGQSAQSFPLSEEQLKALQAQPEAAVKGAKALKVVLGFKPSFALLAFTLPESGYCRKLVVSILP